MVRAFGTRRLFLWKHPNSEAEGRDDCRGRFSPVQSACTSAFSFLANQNASTEEREDLRTESGRSGVEFKFKVPDTIYIEHEILPHHTGRESRVRLPLPYYRVQLPSPCYTLPDYTPLRSP